MTDRLQLVKIGDEIEYRHEGETLRGRVHGWRLSAGHEHHVIVGSTRHEHEVSLRSVLSRERMQGAGSGTVIF